MEPGTNQPHMSVLCSRNYPQPQGRGFTPEPGICQQENLYQQQMCSLLASGQGLRGDPGSQRETRLHNHLMVPLNVSLPCSALSSASTRPTVCPLTIWMLFPVPPYVDFWCFPTKQTKLISWRADREVCQGGSNLTSFSWAQQPLEPGSLWQQGEKWIKGVLFFDQKYRIKS